MCNGGVHATNATEREVLPTTVRPTHYDLTIVPALETFKYTGQVSISLEVNEATKTISANVNEVTVSNAYISVLQTPNPELTQNWPKDPKTGRPRLAALSISYNKEVETVTFDFEHELPVKSVVMLHLEFQGAHNDQMAGFYRSGYTDADGNKKYLVVTQFESTDARRCFPCWDEPNVKATFDVSLVVPKDRTALSNMPVVSESDVEVNNKTLNCVKFATTPIMSTYLLAMCVGEFDYLEAVSRPEGASPIVCRTYTLKGQKELGAFGLDVCTKTLEFFSKYFDVAYPLPKLDMIAIPDFSAGAMENWGLVTYRESALLYDPVKSSVVAKERVAYVVGHELAHQWFGNLVTMDWWNELWLNEGFATYVGWLAVDHIFPEWDVFTSFVLADYENAVRLDSLRTSHPIEVEVKSPSEIAQIFDAISYYKGACVIRMLASYLGFDLFAQGVSKYLKKHAYGNAHTVDLWAALSEVSGRDIGTMMYSWTRVVGYPVVSITDSQFDEAKQELTLTLSQSRFLSSGDLLPEEDQTSWFIPLPILTHQGSSVHLLTEKTGTITFPYSAGQDAFYKLNANVSGFYRVNYSAEYLSSLGKALETDGSKFSITDKIGISADAFALASAGIGSTAGALEVLRSYRQEENQMVLKEVAGRFVVLKNVLYKNEKAIKGLDALQRSIFSPKVAAIGYEYPPTDDHLTVLKRNLVIGAAASAGDEDVINELKARFEKFVGGDKDAFHPNLRNAVFITALKYSTNPEADFAAVFNLYEHGATIDEKISALAATGAINDITIAKRILDEFVLNASKIKVQDCMYPVVSLANNSPLRTEVLELIWEFVTKNWVQMHDAMTPSISGAIVNASVVRCIGEDYAVRAESWAKGEHLTGEAQETHVKQVKKVQRLLEQGLESSRINTKWFERDEENISNWLAAGSYL